MEKIAGKFITIFLLCISSVMQGSQSSIVISMLDMDNKPLQQAMVQSQFVLQVSLNNIDTTADVFYVPGMDNFKYGSAGRTSHVSTYNGKSTTKSIYKFIMRADEKGVYAVGPLQITDKAGKSFQSNVLSIVIDDEIKPLHQNDQVEKYMINCILDKKSVYVGEKNSLHIHFYDREHVDGSSLLLPEFENIVITHTQQKESTIVQHDNGQQYVDTHWIVDFYPTVTGLSIFENIKVRFVDQQNQSNMFGRSFFGLLGVMMNQEQELRARPIGLQVRELPVVKGFQDTVAIGQFSKIEISVNKNSVQQGQGIILSLDLFGNGNLDMISSLPLRLPDGLISYDSDTSQIDKNKNYKHFEYIIQAQESGKYCIPAQKFNYFDPVEKAYKTF